MKYPVVIGRPGIEVGIDELNLGEGSIIEAGSRRVIRFLEVQKELQGIHSLVEVLKRDTMAATSTYTLYPIIQRHIR